MNEQLNINKFSLHLYLHCSYSFSNLGFGKTLKSPKSIHSAVKTISVFRETFGAEFCSSFKDNSLKSFKTDEGFLNYAIPRCLILVEKEHCYFSFLFVAAYIAELVYYFDCQLECCRFCCTGYKCLLAVFRRAFKSKFKEEGGFKGLVNFCLEYKDVYSQKDRKKSIRALIRKLVVFKGKCFVLNEYEQYLSEIDENSLQKAKRNNQNAESPKVEIIADSSSDDELDSSPDIEPVGDLEPPADIKISGSLESPSDIEPAGSLESPSDIESAGNLEPTSALQQAGCVEPSPDLRQAVDLKPPSDLKPAGGLEPPSEIKQAGDLELLSGIKKASGLEPPSGIKKAGGLEPPSDVKKAGGLEPPSDVKKTGGLEPPSDVKQAGDLEPPSDFKHAGDLEPPSDVNQAGGLEPLSDVNQAGGLEPPSDVKQAGVSLPNFEPDNNRESSSDSESTGDNESLSGSESTVHCESLSDGESIIECESSSSDDEFIADCQATSSSDESTDDCESSTDTDSTTDCDSSSDSETTTSDSETTTSESETTTSGSDSTAGCETDSDEEFTAELYLLPNVESSDDHESAPKVESTIDLESSSEVEPTPAHAFFSKLKCEVDVSKMWSESNLCIENITDSEFSKIPEQSAACGSSITSYSKNISSSSNSKTNLAESYDDSRISPWKMKYIKQRSERVCPTCNICCNKYAIILFQKHLDWIAKH